MPMSDLNFKLPLTRSLNTWADNKILDAIQLLGKSLPCTVVSAEENCVTVAFQVIPVPGDNLTLPQVTVPVLTPQYIRLPLQPGDTGLCIAADVSLGGISGLGAGTAGLVVNANLATLAFIPVSSTSWPAVAGNLLVMYGPGGIQIRDQSNSASITISGGAIQIMGNITVTGTITASGDIKAGTISLETHKHTGVTTGGGNTGLPV